MFQDFDKIEAIENDHVNVLLSINMITYNSLAICVLSLHVISVLVYLYSLH